MKSRSRSWKDLSSMYKDVYKRNPHSVEFNNKDICSMSRVKVAYRDGNFRGWVKFHCNLCSLQNQAGSWMGATIPSTTSSGVISSHKSLRSNENFSRNSLKKHTLFLICQNWTTFLSLKQLVAVENKTAMIGLDNQHQPQKLTLGSSSPKSHRLRLNLKNGCFVGIEGKKNVFCK